MICFHFTTFAVLETTPCRLLALFLLLWFAFILLPLPYWKQRLRHLHRRVSVVICFHFTTFAVLETTWTSETRPSLVLWFAFILLPLPYWKQRRLRHKYFLWCCDLLSFYYLCRTGNNHRGEMPPRLPVVICFHFTTFAVLETTTIHRTDAPPSCDLLSFYYLCRTGNNGTWRGCRQSTLWFAFILLPLPYWKQQMEFTLDAHGRCDLLSFYYLCRTGNNCMALSRRTLELWFAFILLPLPYWKQRRLAKQSTHDGCDLLSFYYLCRTGNNQMQKLSKKLLVVICFHFTTFAVLETTRKARIICFDALWFAFILLPLPYWKQHNSINVCRNSRCDLLSFYYLCRTGNNCYDFVYLWHMVVICFHFTTFAVLETTGQR